MGRKKNKRKQKGTAQTGVAGKRSEGGSPEQKIHLLIENGNSKSALDMAKQLAKERPREDPEAQLLLSEAYLARIEGLCASNLLQEAQALAGVARSRCSFSAEMEERVKVALAQHGCIDALLAPLNDPELSVEKRREIEEKLRASLGDPQLLAECEVLAADHPLRVEARALTVALKSVTTGEVSEVETALPEISRKSPLAPWKSLVRAIGAFYKQDDANCRRHLSMLNQGSPAAYFAVSMLAYLDRERGDLPEVEALWNQVEGNMEELHQALSSLDRTLEHCYHDKPMRKKSLAAVSRCMEICRRTRPELVEHLSRRIAVYVFRFLLPGEAMQVSIIGKFPLNAHFWRECLLNYFRTPKMIHYRIICAWECLRRHGLAEGIILPDSIKMGQLHWSLATFLLSLPEEELEDFEWNYKRAMDERLECYEIQPGEYVKQAESIPMMSQAEMFDIKGHIEKACRLAPEREKFRIWKAHLDNNGLIGDQEWAAQVWMEVLPDDPEPCLWQSQSAEERKAFNKALGWLEQAEERDRLNPEVRRARLRLTISIAWRHVQPGKAHLLKKDLSSLGALVENEPVAKIWLAFFRLAWSCLAEKGKETEEGYLESLRKETGNPVAAACLAAGLFQKNHLALWMPSIISADIKSASPEKLLEGVAQAEALMQQANFFLKSPPDLEKKLNVAVKKASSAPKTLVLLAQAAIRWQNRNLAFLTTQKGLAMGGPTLARFLLLRAQCLSFGYLKVRQKEVTEVALALARQNHQKELADEAYEFWQEQGDKTHRPCAFYGGCEELDVQLLPEHIDHVVKMETKKKKPPDAKSYGFSYEETCPCERCRKYRKGYYPEDMDDSAFGDGFDDFGEEDIFDAMREILGNAFKQKSKKRNKKSPDDFSFMDDMFGPIDTD